MNASAIEVRETLPMLSADPPPGADGACCPPLLEGAVSEEEAQAAARVFKALGDPVRVRLLSLIGAAGGGEACVCDLVEAFELRQPTISHHLRVLLDAGLVERERRGTWAFYRLRSRALDAAARALASA
jgi:ArsR family transcriptional regulator